MNSISHTVIKNMFTWNLPSKT